MKSGLDIGEELGTFNQVFCLPNPKISYMSPKPGHTESPRSGCRSSTAHTMFQVQPGGAASISTGQYQHQYLPFCQRRHTPLSPQAEGEPLNRSASTDCNALLIRWNVCTYLCRRPQIQHSAAADCSGAGRSCWSSPMSVPRPDLCASQLMEMPRAGAHVWQSPVANWKSSSQSEKEANFLLIICQTACN